VNLALYFFNLSHAGGAERMIIQLASAMAERGNRVILVSWDKPGTRSYYQIHPFVQWLRLGFRFGIIDKFRRIICLYVKLKNNNIHILTGFVMSGDKVVYAAAKLAGVRLVVAERNAPEMYKYRYNYSTQKLIFYMLHLADVITVQMPGYIKKYPASLRKRIEVISNPVQVVQKKAMPSLSNVYGKYILLSVGRLDNLQKRLDLLIKAFARLSSKFPDWDMRIIGDGPDGESLWNMIKKLDLSDRVYMETSTPDIFKAYTESHLFVIPSLWEGFPNSLVEAMSHGLPAVGFEDAPGVSDLIGAEGWLAKGLYDEHALADALEEAMANPGERTLRGNLSADKMKQFSPDIQFYKWEVLFNSLLETS
jgi:glycosyltransferase involved in cell wall biosynthesis